MKKYIVLVAAVVLAACGSDTSKQSSSGQGDDPGAGIPGGGVLPLPRFTAGTVAVKVIVRKVDTVTVTSPVYDDNGDPVLGPDGQPLTQTSSVTKEVFRYVTDVSPTAPSLMIPNDTGYTIEVISADEAAPVRQILGYYKAEGVTVPVPTGFAIPPVFEFPRFTPAGNPTVFGANPALTFTPVYVGLNQPPYDKYQAISHLAFPFDGAWSITCGAETVAGSGTRATFARPDANGDIACTARFHLGGALMAANPWEFTVTATVTPVPSSPVPLPL